MTKRTGIVSIVGTSSSFAHGFQVASLRSLPRLTESKVSASRDAILGLEFTVVLGLQTDYVSTVIKGGRARCS
jgi:hypothetical protein